MSQNSPEKTNHKPVHFNNEISIGNVLTGIGMFLALATAWFNLDKRVSVNEANLINQSQRTTELQRRIDDRLYQMDRKLDVIVERQIDKN
ncbi:hypothetical protein [Alcanivorax sp. DP30]|uniref:hypothetical protein n=1 Tax=Alcanivorax sp. DP30 TaxID=2606217 RepID=UPI00136FAE31|nr:hypothetical protein [Alcanivorax sp. DP30]MZR63850.1 hypothetical protein [Alcanivorax sp. DP30]